MSGLCSGPSSPSAWRVLAPSTPILGRLQPHFLFYEVVSVIRLIIPVRDVGKSEPAPYELGGVFKREEVFLLALHGSRAEPVAQPLPPGIFVHHTGLRRDVRGACATLAPRAPLLRVCKEGPRQGLVLIRGSERPNHQQRPHTVGRYTHAHAHAHAPCHF